MSLDDTEYLCGTCGDDVCDDDLGIMCEGNCRQWFHSDCIGLQKSEYNILSASDTEWKCIACADGMQPFNSIDAVDVYHFDFQKNMPTPKLPVGDQFYMRMLWTYLFGIYSASHQLMTAFMWHELMARRGADDVISCLAHFIYKTRLGRTGAKHSIWWADNCPGQNKNNYIMWFFQDLVRRKVYSRVDYKFLIPGHTYGPTDRHFAIIEKHAAKIETVYVPDEWYQHASDSFLSSQHRVHVVEMQQSLFLNYRESLNYCFTERTKDKDQKSLNFHNAVWFNFGCGEKVVDSKLKEFTHLTDEWVRHSYDVNEEPQCVSYYKKRGQKSIPLPNRLYQQYPLPIKHAKAVDVSNLAGKYVPSHLRSFYENLPTTTTAEDSDNESS